RRADVAMVQCNAARLLKYDATSPDLNDINQCSCIPGPDRVGGGFFLRLRADRPSLDRHGGCGLSFTPDSSCFSHAPSVREGPRHGAAPEWRIRGAGRAPLTAAAFVLPARQAAMLEWLEQFLIRYPELALFLVIAAGYWIGSF